MRRSDIVIKSEISERLLIFPRCRQRVTMTVMS